MITIPYIEGDGIGPDIWYAAMPVFNAAFAKYGDGEIEWLALPISYRKYEIPEKTLKAIKKYKVAIKGPLTTPVGKGTQSLNVLLRKTFDLYAIVRPSIYIKGVPSPVLHPEKVNMVVFREGIEDVYAGIEFQASESGDLRKFLKKRGFEVRSDAGIGLKPMSKYGSQRLIRRAIQYALANGRKSVTIVHKGNVMKYTEGAFVKWGYELAKKEFGRKVVLEGSKAKGKLVLKDRIADAFFQQALMRPQDYDVIATPNLNGDYLSDALSAQVGGIGIAPSANLGDKYAIFETTHGTAPKYAGLDKANPSSLILSGAMMFDHLGYMRAGNAIRRAFQKTVLQKKVTADLARGMKGAKSVKCSKFGDLVAENL